MATSIIARYHAAACANSQLTSRLFSSRPPKLLRITTMDKQIDTVAELNVNEDVLRSLLDNEILLVGGGEIATNGY